MVGVVGEGSQCGSESWWKSGGSGECSSGGLVIAVGGVLGGWRGC